VVQDSAWEGPIIANATWVGVSNETQLAEVLLNGVKNRNNTSNEFGKVANKATAFFTIELMQTSTLKETSSHSNPTYRRTLDSTVEADLL
jgi:hypothetical protein